VKINIPHMLIGLRELQHEHKPSRWERWAYRLWSMVLCRPRLYRWALAAARRLLRPRARNGWLRHLPGPGGQWTQIRDFPAPAEQSFRDRWKELSS
jgi:L-lactate dehydrogenase complex protein LldF